MKTTIVKQKDVQRKWCIVDADGKVLGRLAVRIARVLRGKQKAAFTPHVDMGDFVIVTNAARVKLTGSKDQQKIYQRYSGYRGGLKEMPASFVRARHPERMIMLAVKRMLPKNRMRDSQMKRLRVYAGAEHPHEAQRPVALP